MTRIGQHNAAVQERNRLVQAAQRALDAARRVLDGLERAAVAGMQRVLGLARGLGTQAAAEREQRAREAERERQQQERQEQARQEAARQEQARWTARVGQVQARLTPVQQAAIDYRERLVEEGRKARQADQEREGQTPSQTPRQGRGMSR